MKHYRPFHEPEEWPLWHDLVICALALSLIFGLFAIFGDGKAGAAPALVKPVLVAAPASLDVEAKMILASFGYSIGTPEHYVKAVQHWQKVNGIWNKSCQCFDGEVGPITIKSLRDALPQAPQSPVSAPKAKTTLPSPKPRAAPPAAQEPPVPTFTGDVPQLIRDIWPDDTEDWAVKIAHRESNFQPEVHNSCCWGLFEIGFGSNRAILAELGITSPQQLLDAETNIRAAVVIFQRSGPAPWFCHGQCKDISL